MATILAAAALMGLIMLAMAVGVMFKRPPLKGSCGGPGGACECDALGKPRECEQKAKRAAPRPTKEP